jgi:hypothetical protein
MIAKMIKPGTGVVIALGVAAVMGACSSSTAGSPSRGAPVDSGTAQPAPTGSGSSPGSTAAAHGGARNPPFTCTPGFVTTLRGYPVSRLVSHYPVPNVKPDAGIAGRRGLAAYRSGTLDVVYTAESTGLPQGPSRRMYSCFVRYASKAGWRPDRHMNATEKKDHKPGDPSVYYFFDSANRFKGGNALSIGFFTAEQAFGHGSQLQLSMDPNGFLPDLRPPPK